MAWRERNLRTESSCAPGLFFRAIVLSIGLSLLSHAHAQDFDREITNLADKISKTLVAKGKKKVAIADFTDLESRPTELGRFLAEQLSVELVNAPGISVMDRANLKSILAEHKLSADGLVNPDTAKKLGQFAGVDAIVLGTITALDDGWVLTVKAVSTETAEIVAANKATLPKTRETQQLSTRGVSSDDTAEVPTRAATIFTKDLGYLRVTLKDMRQTTRQGFGGSKPAIRCVLELANTNLRETVYFAVNGDVKNPTAPRAKVIASSGTVLIARELSGISCISVNYRNPDPAAIASVLMTAPEPGYSPWVGNLLPLPPGETGQATITFAEDSFSPHNFSVDDGVQFECELVVGTASRTTRGFRLYDIVWSNLSVSH